MVRSPAILEIALTREIQVAWAARDPAPLQEIQDHQATLVLQEIAVQQETRVLMEI
jgi:hypothetical protein